MSDRPFLDEHIQQLVHGLSNPLGVLEQQLAQLRKDLRALWLERPDPRLDELCRRAQGLGEVVDHVQNIARGALRMVAQEDARGLVDPREALEFPLRLIQPAIERRAQMTTDLRAVPLVWANPAKLGQVFINLLLNAAHAIPEGDPSVHRVTVTTARESDVVVVEVGDTGQGIPSEDLERVFELHFTTKGSGQGHGLGLAIARSEIRALGGDIRVESEFGSGTRFRVTLPVAPAE